MNILFVTINDNQYLPALFDKVFKNKQPTDNYKVLLTRPLYKNESFFRMILKYYNTFGFLEFSRFSLSMIRLTLLDFISQKKGMGSSFSVEGVSKLHGVSVLKTNKDVNNEEIINQIKELNIDLVISIACPHLFKETLISTPPKGCLNLHGSPLPKYRGVLPSFWMLKNEEKKAFNTVFFINKVIDGGDILVQQSFSIEKSDTLHSLISRSKIFAADVINESIKLVKNGDYKVQAIDPSNGSYFGWPSKKDVHQFHSIGRKLR